MIKKIAFLSLLFVPVCANAASLLHMFGGEGEFISQGKEYYFVKPATAFTGKANYTDTSKSVEITFTSPSDNFTLTFAAADNAPLRIGTYEGAARFPFNPAGKPGLSVSGNGRGCNELQGSFKVKQVALRKNGVVRSFAADFIQFCDGSTVPLKGSIRLNSMLGDNVHEVLSLGDAPYDLRKGLIWNQSKKRVGYELMNRRTAVVFLGDVKLKLRKTAEKITIQASKPDGSGRVSSEMSSLRVFFVTSPEGVKKLYFGDKNALTVATAYSLESKQLTLEPAGGLSLDLTY